MDISFCAVPACDELAEKRALCGPHYQELNRRGVFNETTQVLIAESRRTDWYEYSKRLTDYKLRMVAAEARLNQALLILTLPAEYPKSAYDCARDAAVEIFGALVDMVTQSDDRKDSDAMAFSEVERRTLLETADLLNIRIPARKLRAAPPVMLDLPAAAPDSHSRHHQIIALLALGYENREIGDKLGLSVDTIKTHARTARIRFQANNAASLVNRGWQQKLLPHPDLQTGSRRDTPRDFKDWTPRRREIVYHAANGLSVTETGDLMGVSDLTVKSHRSLMMRKLGARNSAHLVNMAWEDDVLPISSHRDWLVSYDEEEEEAS
jgi:DNA-binding NarL/FixJ family response regulator